ncbi:MAG TPA: response regulator [Solirubrobacteraceae bacterium]|nr:response regulator [Solirubrobacteraceae bacterium]
MRVLVAEDESRVADALARGLRRQGLAVDVAADGATALYKARVTPYDVVVLDRDLPELHGDDVCRALNAEQPDTKVLMLTAAGRPEDVVGGLSLGADDYLAKPFHFGELVARIRALGRRNGNARPAVLRRGDLITRVGATRVSESGDVASAISRLRPGATVQLTITRDGNERTERVKLGTRPEEASTR